MPKNSIYKGTLMHKRFVPKEHKFTYSIFYTLINIDDLDDLKKKYIFFSYNSFNLFSIYDRDHGPRNNKKIKPWILNILKKTGIKTMNNKIFILSIQRILGHVFNPLTIFFCYNYKNNLEALIYEVKNTFNEQHCYVFKLNKKDLKKKYFNHSCKKKFHVSPFWDMSANYNFKIKNPDYNFFSSITMNKNNKKIFNAVLNCKYKKINYKNLLILFLKFPFLTIKVVLAIYFEAFKIFIFKGAKYFKKPRLNSKLTLNKK